MQTTTLIDKFTSYLPTHPNLSHMWLNHLYAHNNVGDAHLRQAQETLDLIKKGMKDLTLLQIAAIMSFF